MQCHIYVHIYVYTFKNEDMKYETTLRKTLFLYKNNNDSSDTSDIPNGVQYP